MGRLDLIVELDERGNPPRHAQWVHDRQPYLYELAEDERAISTPENLYVYK